MIDITRTRLAERVTTGQVDLPPAWRELIASEVF